MMSEIVRTRDALATYITDKRNRTAYYFKRQAIQNCLYGVDVDPGAVEIAKLRLWLSLVVDEQDRKRIKALPNLDYKIMQGNSLFEEFDGRKLFDEKFLVPVSDKDEWVRRMKERRSEIQQEYIRLHTSGLLDTKKKQILEMELGKLGNSIKQATAPRKRREHEPEFPFDQLSAAAKKANELRQLHEEFFGAERKTKKDKLKDRIEKLEWELIEATLKEQNSELLTDTLKRLKMANEKPFFLWKLNFGEVFQENGGFDVVIANPPYVEHKKLKEFSTLFKSDYRTYTGTTDLYVYFYEKGLSLLKDAGVLAFISSNKFMRTRYGAKLRGLLSSLRMCEVIDFTKVRVFKALVATCVLIVLKQKREDETIFSFADDTMADFLSLADFVKKNHLKIKTNDLDDNIWNVEGSKELTIKSKIESSSNMLGDLKGIGIFRGVTTGCNEAFVIDEATRTRLVKKDSRNEEIIKPLLQGRNIRRWVYEKSSAFLLQTNYDLDVPKEYPRVFDHLSKIKNQLEKRSDQGKSWWNLRACSYYGEFEKQKAVWGLTADKWAFAYDNGFHYLPSNGYILTSTQLSIKYLLAMLNSNLLKFYFRFIGIMTAGGAYTLKHETIMRLPIKEEPLEAQGPFIDLVDKILQIAKSEDYFADLGKQTQVKEYERQIDQMVYKLYGLTPEEIEIVEKGRGDQT
jgi:hypothetical protein